MKNRKNNIVRVMLTECVHIDDIDIVALSNIEI